MSLDVRWTEEAEITFDNIYMLIQNRWSISAAEKFRHKVLKLLLSISSHPEMFPKVFIGNTHKAVITKQTSVFYEVYDDHIALIFFWDNRQDPLLY